MWNYFVSGGKDSWRACVPVAKERIFSLIEQNNISGVLLNIYYIY